MSFDKQIEKLSKIVGPNREVFLSFDASNNQKITTLVIVSNIDDLEQQKDISKLLTQVFNLHALRIDNYYISYKHLFSLTKISNMPSFEIISNSENRREKYLINGLVFGKSINGTSAQLINFLIELIAKNLSEIISRISKVKNITDLEEVLNNSEYVLNKNALSQFKNNSGNESKYDLSGNVDVSPSKKHVNKVNFVNSEALFQNILKTENEIIFDSGCLQLMKRIRLFYHDMPVYSTEVTFWGIMKDATILENIFAQKISKPGLVYICNPNNPSNTYHAKEKLIKLIQTNPESIFMIDETMLLFASDFYERTLANQKFNNVIVVYSISKITGKPGMRIGVAVTNKQIAKNYHNKMGKTEITSFVFDWLSQWDKKTNGGHLSRQKYQRGHELLVKNAIIGPFKLIFNDFSSGFFLIKSKSVDQKSSLMTAFAKSRFQVNDLNHYYGDNNLIRVSAANPFLIKEVIIFLKKIPFANDYPL